ACTKLHTVSFMKPVHEKSDQNFCLVHVSGHCVAFFIKMGPHKLSYEGSTIEQNTIDRNLIYKVSLIRSTLV
ncbi:hypothetical protein L9F63_019187, partial [Diploptera punctata]